MYLISVPIVVTSSALADGSGDGMVYTVSSQQSVVFEFRAHIFPEKTEEYDRLERESRTKMRNLEQEMLEKPVELCLYGLQKRRAGAVKVFAKGLSGNAFCQKGEA